MFSPPGDDHVVDAAVDPEIAVLVEVPGVARVVPAVADRLLVGVRAVPVAGEGLVGGEVDADLAVLGQPQPRVDGRASRAAGLLALLGADRARVDLGRPVVVDEHLRVELLASSARRGSTSSPRRRSRSRAPSRGRRRGCAEPLEQVVEERRREVQRADALLGDQVERRRRRSSAPAGTKQPPTRCIASSEWMPIVWYSGITPSVRSCGCVAVLQRLRHAAGAVGGVRARDALRPAGRARGVEHQRRSRGRRGRARRGAAARPAADRRRGSSATAPQSARQ